MPRQNIESHHDATATAVLGLLVELHPGQLHTDEVVREIAADPSDFGDRDAVTVALAELAQTGLVHRHDGFVFASRAAVRAEELRL